MNSETQVPKILSILPIKRPLRKKLHKFPLNLYNSPMQGNRGFFGYLATLEWTEQVQHNCIFCDPSNFASIVYEDDDLIAVDNIRLAGQFHWLIMPKQHTLRDIEQLDGDHLPLLRAMNDVKRRLLHSYCPGSPSSAIHSGYHRGRRPLIGKIYYPDIISVHHLHLHVIVKPSLFGWLLKYPTWLPLMWKSDARVIQEVEQMKSKAS